jgi:hypothetical protein
MYDVAEALPNSNYFDELYIAEEAANNLANKFFIKVEEFMAKAIACYQKFTHMLRKAGKHYLPKEVYKNALELSTKFAVLSSTLYMDSFKKGTVAENWDLGEYRQQLVELQNDEKYIKLMNGKKEDYSDDDRTQVDSNKIVKQMDDCSDNLKNVKIRLAKDKREPNVPKERMEMWSLLMTIITEHLKVLGKFFTFGKGATKTTVTPLEQPVNGEVKD